MAGWKIWLQGLPRITSAEIAMAGAAVVCFYVVPVILAWGEARRRRKALLAAASSSRALGENEMAETATDAAASTPEVPLDVPAVDEGVAGAESSVDMGFPGQARIPDGPAEETEASGVGAAETIGMVVRASVPAADAVDTAPSPPSSAAPMFEASDLVSEPPGGAKEVSLPTSPIPEPSPAPPTSTALTQAAQMVIRSLDGRGGCRFTLDELRLARLPGWPPAAVRDDPQRYEAWRRVEEKINTHWRDIGAVSIESPYPARSACLGATEIIDSRYRAYFLLFPVLWPVAESQAVAQAVLEIDPASGTLSGWVDALRAAELTADHRREIRASGGNV